ncbi:hypothetical protein ACFFLM_10740 [Deinococcus oregonensis]|uniref:N-acetyltransferase n=1 Tax=Deinococcus oregonensis TaxID=1805970 RepID=A0ABV6AY64_9DEIO
MSLPARVRVTRPPLPLAPALRNAVVRMFPTAPVKDLTAAALVIAGGAVIGGSLRWNGGEAEFIESGWRGRGIEEELARVLAG